MDKRVPQCPEEEADTRHDPAFPSDADFDRRIGHPKDVPIVQRPLANHDLVIQTGAVTASQITDVNGIILGRERERRGRGVRLIGAPRLRDEGLVSVKDSPGAARPSISTSPCLSF